MPHDPPPPTTHTVEMDQIRLLNAKLGEDGPKRRPPVTAADLEMTGAHGSPRVSGPLVEDAVLVRLCWDGSPTFPDVHGHFAAAEGRTWVVDLHTTALVSISRLMDTRQRWGVDPVS